jgi:hypothetical protein
MAYNVVGKHVAHICMWPTSPKLRKTRTRYTTITSIATPQQQNPSFQDFFYLSMPIRKANLQVSKRPLARTMCLERRHGDILKASSQNAVLLR